MADSRARPKIYLAGPSVFYPDSAAYAAALKGLCNLFGLEGAYPMDGLFHLKPDLTPPEIAIAIKSSNKQLIRSTDGVLADYTPFRGEAMDTGTAWEVGFAEGIEKPIGAYTTSDHDYLTRVKARIALRRDDAGQWCDSNGHMVEDFGLADNLMLCADLRVRRMTAKAAADIAILIDDHGIRLPAANDVLFAETWVEPRLDRFDVMARTAEGACIISDHGTREEANISAMVWLDAA